MRVLFLPAPLVWLGLLAFAFTNGSFRELVLVRPLSPAAAEAFSALLLALLIILSSWLLVRWTPRRHPFGVWLGIGILKRAHAGVSVSAGALGRSCLPTTICGTPISVSPSR